MKVNRKQTLKEAIDSLGYEYVCISPDVKVENKGEEDVEIELVNFGKNMTNEGLRTEFKSRGLESDLFATIQYLKENPDVLKEKKYIGVLLDGSFFAAFRWWLDGRDVSVDQFDNCWGDGWFFPLVRKSLKSKKLKSLDTLNLELPDKLEINGVTYIKENK